MNNKNKRQKHDKKTRTASILMQLETLHMCKSWNAYFISQGYRQMGEFFLKFQSNKSKAFCDNTPIMHLILTIWSHQADHSLPMRYCDLPVAQLSFSAVPGRQQKQEADWVVVSLSGSQDDPLILCQFYSATSSFTASGLGISQLEPMVFDAAVN